MTDNNRKGNDPDSAFGEDFDFSTWTADDAGDDASGGRPAGGSADSAGSYGEDAGDPFSDFQMGAEDSYQAGKSAEGFGTTEEDDFFESDEFQGMPMPNSSALGGDDDEFADIGADGGGNAQPADDGGAYGFTADASAGPSDGDDDGFVDDDVFTGTFTPAGDELAEEEEADGFTSSGEQTPAATPQVKPPLSRLAFPALAIAGLAAVVYGGYAFVLPMLGGDAPSVPVAQAPHTSAPVLPKGLPGMEGGLNIPGAGSSSPKASLPQQAALPVPMQKPNLPPQVAPPEQAAPPSRHVDAQDPSQEGGLPPLATTGPALSFPDLPVKGPDPADELVGGKGRGGLGANPVAAAPLGAPPVPVRAPAEAAAIERQIASLRADFDAIRGEIASLTARLDEIRSAKPSISSAASPDEIRSTKPSIPSAAFSGSRAGLPEGVVPPLKPAILDGFALKGVMRDVAWVSTKAGVVEVREGDSIPGAGQVVRFRPYGGDWVLVTTQGIVTR